MILLESSIRAVVLAAGVAMVLGVMRVRGAAARHAAWTAVMLAMLFMPLLSRITPPLVLRSVTFPALRFVSDPIQVDPPSLPASRATADPDPAGPPATSAAGSSSQARVPIQPPVPGHSQLTASGWLIGGLVVYGSGVLMLFGRLVIGWRAMRRVIRSTRQSSPATSDDVYESPAVTSPLTAGILRPRIVLPSTWPAWSDDMREAVLAHERAHVRRRDALVSLLAHANRCVFWFHPLAWWLERTIARTAEEACDDAGVRTLEPRRYAEVLMSMAAAVRERGGRVAWQGLGVSGNGSLTLRIDRVLRGDAAARLSRSQRVMTFAGSAAVIALAIACQAQGELRPDPAIVAKLAAEKARSAPSRERQKTMDAMTPDKALAMEAALRSHPDDFDARAVLIEYYIGTYARTEPQRLVELKRPHALWLIEHAPEADATSWWARFYPQSKTGDLEGYEAGKKLWLAHLAKPDVTARLLRIAAAYFKARDVPKAEELLLRGQAVGLVDSQNPGRLWSVDLAEFYVDVLMADAGFYAPPDRRPPYDEHAFAGDVRRTLTQSNDAVMLAAIAGRLMPRAVFPGAREATIRPVAQASLDRALLLDPKSTEATRLQARIPAMERDARLARFTRFSQNAPPTPAEVGALSDADRFYVLPRLAKITERRGNEAAWAGARTCADEALALAPRFTSSPDYSSDVFMAHMMLGLLDVRAHRSQDAVAHLLAASAVPPSDGVDANANDLQISLLLTSLLKEHEQAAVVRFLEQTAKTSPADATWLLDSAGKIRKGLMPEWYQRMQSGLRVQ